MRRPLAFLCLSVVLFVFLSVSFGVLPAGKGPDLPGDGEYITADGRIVKTAGKYMLFKGDVVSGDVKYTDIALLVSFSDEDTYVSLGERVVLYGRVRHFSHAMNPGQFDAYDHYTSKGGDAFLRDAGVSGRKGGVYSVREGMRRLREVFKTRLYDVCPEKEASILADLLLGDKEGIDEETEKLYRNNGIAHILSISGLHISILGMGLFRILRKSGWRQVPAAMAASLVLVLYGIMTGMSISATRAIGMFLIRMFAYPVKRTPDPLTSLSVMAAVTVIADPLNACQAGFLLSYGAALGIIVFLPAFERMATSGTHIIYKAFDTVLRAFRASLAITLFTLPVQLYFFYKVSLYSVFLNLFILPCMSVLVFCAMISLMPGLGICASVSCILLDMFEILCRAAERMPFHTYCPGRPGKIWIALYYLCVILVAAMGHMIIPSRKISLKRPGLCLTGMVLLMITLTEFPLLAHNTSQQLYVGQGNCNVTVTDAGEVYMFDGGSSSETDVGEYIILPYLKFNGLTHIDAVFISHSDTDHISGILELIDSAGDEGIDIESVYVTPQLVNEGSENSQAIADACREAHIPLKTMAAGTEWDSGDTHFTCLHPTREYVPEDPNSGSMCILAEFGPKTVLFPGDVQGSGEDALAGVIGEALGSRRLDIYITAHHGSNGTTTDEFLDEARPRLAINSAGLNNRYHHPGTETLGRLESHGTAYLTTFETGAVRVDLRGKEIEIRTFL